MRTISRWFAYSGLILAAFFAAAGCKRAGTKPVANSPKNLRAIYTAYVKATDALGAPPANANELLPYLKEIGATEEVFRSPEDGQEYVVHWGCDASANPAVVLAYEKTGKGGRRYVQWGHSIWFQTVEELKKARFPPGFEPPS